MNNYEAREREAFEEARESARAHAEVSAPEEELFEKIWLHYDAFKEDRQWTHEALEGNEPLALKYAKWARSAKIIPRHKLLMSMLDNGELDDL